MELTRIAQAHIASVISQHELAINAGEDRDVELDDLVIVPRRIDVRDPATGELLGDIERPLLRLRVTEVLPKFSVAQVADYVEADPSSWGSRRRLKKVTEQAVEADHETIVIEVGQKVAIYRSDI